MIIHQFSKHFAASTDKQFKDDEFEKSLSEYFVGFIQAYPHLVTKRIENGVEVYIFKFAV